MVSSVNNIASTIAAPEVVSPNTSSAAPESSVSSEFQEISQAVIQSDEAHTNAEINKTGSGNTEQKRSSGNSGETRKMEVKDGEMIIRVYDSSGKLLRKIPPGYLPAGEQKFDVTV